MNFSSLLNDYTNPSSRKGSNLITIASTPNIPGEKRASNFDAQPINRNKQLKRNQTKMLIFHANEGFHGDVTHYYHFFFAAFLPMLEHHLANPSCTYIIASNIGPMKSLLCEMSFNIIEFRGPDNILRPEDVSSSANNILLPAYDNFSEPFFEDHNTVHISKSTISKVCDYLSNNIPVYISQLPTRDIILIERTNRETYYNALSVIENNKIGGDQSGADIRCIQNHSTLAEALTSKYGDRFQNISLERCGMFYQFHLFHHAKVVIAQHGAALSNIVFMRPRSYVVEIKPPAHHLKTEQQISIARAQFRNLSQYLDLQYTCVTQEHDLAEVSVENVLQSIEDI